MIRKFCILFQFIGFCLAQIAYAGWSTPIAISTSVSDQPDISVDEVGNIVVAWQGFDGNNYVIQSASKPVNGTWSAPVTLSDAGQDAQRPILAHDASGNFVAVWSRYDGQSSIIQSANLPINGSWSSPVNLSSTNGNADSATIALDTLGGIDNAVAVWHRFNGTNFVIQGATMPAGGNWTSAVNISASGRDALVPQVDIDQYGNSVITCIRYNGTDFDILCASQLYSQTWGPNFTLNVPGETTKQPAIAVNRLTGTAYVVWSQFNGDYDLINFSALPLGGSWSSAQTISLTTQNSYTPYIVVDTLGNATAVWSSFNGAHYELQSASKSALGVWSSPYTISDPAKDVGTVDLCIDPLGQVTVVWDCYDEGVSEILSAQRPLNGSWSSPIVVSTPGKDAYLADASATQVNSEGVVSAVWLELEGTDYVVKTSTLY